jgi:predicted phage terminase large subunit-like protein
LFEPLIDRACEAHGLPPLPMVLIHNSADKADRIRTLEPYLARRKLRIRDTEGGRLLVRQLKGFGVAEHDDGPDALEMALRCLNRVAVEAMEGV